MKRLTRWFTIPATVAISLTIAGKALSQAIAILPNSPTIQVSGVSGGTQKDSSCAGFISASPNHVVQVAEDSNLVFALKSSGQPALLIHSTAGHNFCVPADSYSNGSVEIPGRWAKGTYSVYVGDRAGGQHPYTLSISRN
jgi:hypothetical protein